MSIIFIMIPIALLLVAFACGAFFWAVGSGQFDELDASAWEILVDDQDVPKSIEPGVLP